MIKINFKTTALKQTKDFGQFELSPLESGYGHTLGNALRRVLLSSLPGSAITKASVEGISHQFSTLQGLKEDIVELMLNLKQVKIKYDGQEPVTAKLQAAGPKKVIAKDLKTPANVTIINPDFVLATLADKKSKLDLEVEISSGYGYLPIKDREKSKLGEILLDAAFSPVVQVNYQVETARVGRRADFDKLIIDIYTDGTIKPETALKKSADILISFFTQIVKPTFDKKKKIAVTEVEESESLKLSVEELDLPTRIANALRKGGYSTVKDLQTAKKSDISKVKNLGGKSVNIIIKKLKNKGVELTD